jgi:hypothetical protein
VEGYTLFMRKSIHDPHVTAPMLVPAGPPAAATRLHSTHTLRRASSSEQRALKTLSRTQHNVRTTGPWIDVHTLVVDRGPIPPRMVVRSSWFPSENFVLGGRMEQKNHIPSGLPYKPHSNYPQLQTVCIMCITSLYHYRTMYHQVRGLTPRISRKHG